MEKIPYSVFYFIHESKTDDNLLNKFPQYKILINNLLHFGLCNFKQALTDKTVFLSTFIDKIFDSKSLKLLL